VFLQSSCILLLARMTISALIIDDEQLAREELAYLLAQVGGVEVVAQGANASRPWS